IRQAVTPVQHHASGTLQKSTFLFVSRIIEPTPDDEFLFDSFDYVSLALKPPVRSKHRIKYGCTIFMKGHPIIRKNTIRRLRYRCISDRQYIDVDRPQCVDEVVELRQGLSLNTRSMTRRLERVVYRRFGIISKANRSDHQDRHHTQVLLIRLIP